MRLAGLLFALTFVCGAAQLGTFEGNGDIGSVEHPGSGQFDGGSRTYTVTGSGANVWGTSDQFHFVWKKIANADAAIAATILLNSGGDPHRKAMLMFRQSLDGDSAYVDAAIHGSGLAALQFRQSKGAPTHEIEALAQAPSRLRLVKRGNNFYLFTGSGASPFAFAGGSIALNFTAPFYVGVGVCAHNKDAELRASFQDVEVDTGEPYGKPQQFATVQTIDPASTVARAVYVTGEPVDSASFSEDGSAILFNNGGKVMQVPAAGGDAQASGSDLPNAFAQDRSADGRYLYVSNNRTGWAQLWRTASDGTNPEQLTNDPDNDVFPHLSPDGNQVVFLSYARRFPMLAPNMDVNLEVLNLPAHKMRIIARFTAGPLSLGGNPWSPDGKRVTFTSYQKFVP